MKIPFTDIFTYWVLQTIAMCITALLIPKLKVTSIFGALGTVLTLALINATIWNAALFFSVPNAISYQVLLLFLANGLIFWATVKLLPGIEVEGILPALIAPLVFTVFSLLIDHYGKNLPWWEVIKATIEWIKQVREYFLAGKSP